MARHVQFVYMERKLWCFMGAIDRAVQAFPHTFEEDIEVSTNFD